MHEEFKEGVGLTLHGKKIGFRVWAPNATAVSVTGDFNDWQEVSMKNEGDGYWYKELVDVEPGATYKYVIYKHDGEKLYRNDPRGMQITESDDGASVIPDFRFDWGDDKFKLPPKDKIIIYEMHVGTFNRADRATTGSFYDAIEKLDYLQNLGVTAIELMPITSMSKGHGWGYAPNYIYAVENSYGGRKGFMEFVKACHQRGIGVILDLVYNHFDGYYLWQFDGWSENNNGGIYFYNDERGETPWGARPDYGRPEVRQYILDNMKMWLVDYHVDGLRIDSTLFIRNRHGHNDDPDNDLAEAWSLMANMNTLAHDINPHVLTIAEDSSTNEFITKPSAEGGCGFDAQWDLSLPHALRHILEGDSDGMDDLRHSVFANYNGDYLQKVVFADSHDTAANGSKRILDQTRFGKENDVASRKVAILVSAVALTVPGIPMLLQGQEFMQGGSFTDWAMLDWEKSERFGGIVQAVQHLIDLRLNKHGNTKGLLGVALEIFHENHDNRVLGYRRGGGKNNAVLVIINFSKDHIKGYRFQVPGKASWTVRFNSSWKGYSNDFSESMVDEIVPDKDGMAEIELMGYMVLILSRSKLNDQ